MLSGRRLDVLDPSPLDVEIEDIAHGLARVARWNGQTRGGHIFSVAQHSLLVEAINTHLEPEMSAPWQLMTLLHDAPEYVVGDMISPFKAVLGGDYRSIEERLLSAIHIRFGLPALTPVYWKTAIKRADAIAAWHEATRLAGFTAAEADQYFPHAAGFEPPDTLIVPMPPREAQERFLDAFHQLATLHEHPQEGVAR
jgi:5'-deoxynucleotidase YfbR-like HD superfamily hydrolase